MSLGSEEDAWEREGLLSYIEWLYFALSEFVLYRLLCFICLTLSTICPSYLDYIYIYTKCFTSQACNGKTALIPSSKKSSGIHT